LSEEKKKKEYYYGGEEKKAGELKKASEEEEGMIPYFSRDVQREFNRMMDRFQRVFESLWEEPPRLRYEKFMRRHPLMPFRGEIMPSVDLEDRGKDFRVTIDLPGFSKENVDVEVGDDSVTINARQTMSEEEKKKNYVRRERLSQAFYRRVQLPEGVKSDEVKANLSNGVLELVLPKKEPKETKKIRIE